MKVTASEIIRLSKNFEFHKQKIKDYLYKQYCEGNY